MLVNKGTSHEVFIIEFFLGLVDELGVLFECEFAVGVGVMQGNFIPILFDH
jgi:hypothetical protein